MDVLNIGYNSGRKQGQIICLASGVGRYSVVYAVPQNINTNKTHINYILLLITSFPKEGK
jgi:hypothetical protein